MLIIAILYLFVVYLLFFKLKLMPWNKITQGITVFVGVVILALFLVGLQALTPASVRGSISGRIIEIAPGVSGEVIEVQAEPGVFLESGEPLFSLDSVPYEARVEELDARLALAELRLEQYLELAESDAGTQFQVQQTEAEVKQLRAQLSRARFDLDKTIVRAPSRGLVPRMFLEPGMQVSPARAVMTFVDTESLVIAAQFQQKALRNVKVGDLATINFPALPGHVFDAEVIGIPTAIGNAQVSASGQLPNVEHLAATRIYPVIISIPEGFPDDLRKVGIAAAVTIHTEGAGVVGIVATILQWVSTSLDAVI